MSEEANAILSRRYVALDIHKHYCVVAAVNRDGEVTLEPVRVEHEGLERWLQKHLLKSDQVVIESTTNAWHVYDLLEPWVEQVLVANPIKVKQIACARVKTDIRDTLILARLLAANLVPTVWVPPVHVRELRQLLSQRRSLVGMHTQGINRMHSTAHRHHLNHPKGKRFLPKNTAWQKEDVLSTLEKLQLELEMETREHLRDQIDRITTVLARMSHQAPWNEGMQYLTLAPPARAGVQLPGFGVVTGMTVLAAIGDVSRFAESPAPGELLGIDARRGAEWGKAAWQRDHEGRTAGVTLGYGGSGPACSEVRPALAVPLQRTPAPDAQEPGDCRDCPSPAGVGLVCPDSQTVLPAFLTRTHRVQVPDLVLATQRRRPGWADPPAIRAVLPYAIGDRARSRANCA